MKAKTLMAAALAMGVISVASAQTAPSVTDTSKKGSLLIFPMINVDPSISADTIVEISNDETSPVQVECEYVNEQKGRVDFSFNMSGKATVSWDVGTATGDGVFPPQFPSYGDYPVYGSLYRGELVCFAVNSGLTGQIAWNHLHGTATVEAVGSAVKYSPWSFWALDSNGPATDNSWMGTAGNIQLTGAPGAYDACPLYNTTSFMPNKGTLGSITTNQNYLAVASCNQDLRQDYQIHTTKLLFNVYNAQEQGFSGSYICIDSIAFMPLGDSNTSLTNQTNFDYKTLGTANAMYDVQGIPSTQCTGSYAGATSAGLLGVVASYAKISNGTPAVLGSNLHSAGAQPGFVYWDPRQPVPATKKR